MSVTVQEKSLQLALVKAAGQLGITQDDLDHKILNVSKGLFGIFGKKVQIEAWKKGSESQRFRREKQVETTLELTAEETVSLKESLRVFCQEICELISGEATSVAMETIKERLILNVDNEYLADQFAKNTKLAESIEHIIRKKPRHIRRELPFRVFVDVNRVRQARETELIEMAEDLSAKVYENKRPIVLNYRSSHDRKIIHMALDRDQRVLTKSIGTGSNRKLMILPNGKEDEQSPF
jgi:spoIIIJ-associated protein